MLLAFLLQATPVPAIPPAPIIPDEWAKWLLGLLAAGIVASIGGLIRFQLHEERERRRAEREHAQQHEKLMEKINRMNEEVRLHGTFLEPQIMVYQRILARALSRNTQEDDAEDE